MAESDTAVDDHVSKLSDDERIALILWWYGFTRAQVIGAIYGTYVEGASEIISAQEFNDMLARDPALLEPTAQMFDRALKLVLDEFPDPEDDDEHDVYVPTRPDGNSCGGYSLVDLSLEVCLWLDKFHENEAAPKR